MFQKGDDSWLKEMQNLDVSGRGPPWVYLDLLRTMQNLQLHNLCLHGLITHSMVVVVVTTIGNDRQRLMTINDHYNVLNLYLAHLKSLKRL